MAKIKQVIANIRLNIVLFIHYLQSSSNLYGVGTITFILQIEFKFRMVPGLVVLRQNPNLDLLVSEACMYYILPLSAL